MSNHRPYSKIPERETAGTISKTLKLGWKIAHLGSNPVAEAKRALCIRRWLKVVITLLVTTAIITTLTGLTVEPSFLAVSILIALIIWLVVSIRRSVRAPGADEFLDKHDLVLAWLGYPDKENPNDMRKSAEQALKGQCLLIIGFEKTFEKDEARRGQARLHELYDLFLEFSLVQPGGVGPFFPKKSTPVVKKRTLDKAVTAN